MPQQEGLLGAGRTQKSVSAASALAIGFAALVLQILSATPLYVSFFALFLGSVKAIAASGFIQPAELNKG